MNVAQQLIKQLPGVKDDIVGFQNTQNGRNLTFKSVYQCCQSVGFSPKSQDFWSSDLLIIKCKFDVLGFFFNMAPLSTIHLHKQS